LNVRYCRVSVIAFTLILLSCFLTACGLLSAYGTRVLEAFELLVDTVALFL
jgi:hypothetical protein